MAILHLLLGVFSQKKLQNLVSNSIWKVMKKTAFKNIEKQRL